MVGLSVPGDRGGSGEESGGSGGSTETSDGVETGPVVPPSDGETVEFFEEERPLPEAVELMARKLDEPGSFGLATEGELRDLREKVEQLQERVEAQDETVAELVSDGLSG